MEEIEGTIPAPRGKQWIDQRILCPPKIREGVRIATHTKSQNLTNRPHLLDKCELSLKFCFVLGIEAGALGMLHRYSTTELCLQACTTFCLVLAEVRRWC